MGYDVSGDLIKRVSFGVGYLGGLFILRSDIGMLRVFYEFNFLI